MITFKDTTKEDLKKDYINRHGFIFEGPIRSSDRAIEHLCNILINHDITKEYPDFVSRLDDKTLAFVYKDDFYAPAFFHQANVATMMGICKISTIIEYLK